jgi:thiosulfate/3-mercaptopyruvate sulfurtransferase
MKTMALVVMGLLLAACAGKAAPMPPLVSADWLATHVHEHDLVLLHVGEADAYAKAHIAGARLVTLGDVSVSGGAAGRSIQLPSAAALHDMLEALGISDDSRVVVYCGQDWLSPATRVLFTLEQAGFGGRAALLDGGMAAWQRAGQPVTAEITPVRKGRLAAIRLRTDQVVEIGAVTAAAAGTPGVVVVDARDREFYDGSERGGMPGHEHALGHIPGAKSVPHSSVWEADGRLKSDAELRRLFDAAGVAPGATVIGYCHIGIQATGMLFAARKLGHPVRLYDGSFEDWSAVHP